MTEREPIEKTHLRGQASLARIIRSECPAFPRNYELWYTYFAASHPALNLAIKKILKTRGRLSDEDARELFETFLSSRELDKRIEKAGAELSGSIAKLSGLAEAGRTTTAEVGSALSAAAVELSLELDRARLRQLATHLAGKTSAAADRLRQLEASLIQSRGELDELRSSLDSLRHESLQDQVTGLMNRKHFDNALIGALATTVESMVPFALLMIDVDHFKRFNDKFGHQTGDEVLQLTAGVLKSTLKAEDVACRYGGDEFAVILENSSLASARAIAETVLQKVAAQNLIKKGTGEKLGRITYSIGVAVCHPGDSAHSIVERADQCLYAAKKAGRARVFAENERQAA